jgi:hypothetical protein
MSWVKKLGVLVVSSAMVGAPTVKSFGQGGPAGFMDAYFEAHEAAGVRCPALTWHFNRMVQPDKTVKINGPIWFEDGSGVSFAQGTGQADGHFMLEVKQMSGNGPSGSVSGQRMPDGSINATAVGPACFAGTVHLAPGQTAAKM